MNILVGMDRQTTPSPKTKPMTLKELTNAVNELQNTINDLNQQISELTPNENVSPDELFELYINKFGFSNTLISGQKNEHIIDNTEIEVETNVTSAESLFKASNNLLNNNLLISIINRKGANFNINMTKQSGVAHPFQQLITDIIYNKTQGTYSIYNGELHLLNSKEHPYLIMASIDIKMTVEDIDTFRSAVDFDNDNRTTVGEISTITGYMYGNNLPEDHKNKVEYFLGTFLKDHMVFTYKIYAVNNDINKMPFELSIDHFYTTFDTNHECEHIAIDNIEIDETTNLTLANTLFNVTNNLKNDNVLINIFTHDDKIDNINMNKSTARGTCYAALITGVIHDSVDRVYSVYNGSSYVYDKDNNMYLLLASIDIQVTADNINLFKDVLDFSDSGSVSITDVINITAYFSGKLTDETVINKIEHFLYVFLKDYMVFTYTLIPIENML